jgi:excisionase family DNA binding protein
MKSKAAGQVSDRMLTTSEVAERLSVSERTVFRWLEQGHLKAFRAGRVLRISEASVEVFLTASMKS